MEESLKPRTVVHHTGEKLPYVSFWALVLIRQYRRYTSMRVLLVNYEKMQRFYFRSRLAYYYNHGRYLGKAESRAKRYS